MIVVKMKTRIFAVGLLPSVPFRQRKLLPESIRHR